MYNTSGRCISVEERIMDGLTREGRKELDTSIAREYGVQIQRAEAELAAVLYTVSPQLHVSWTSKVQGEHPDEYKGAFTGTRQIVLTHIR
jgi:hypothetical protein